ncbi:MAG: methyltransferase domain-containing protein [Deltaproteobacteria bacterium]|nr:methyltransferase domain-containing protein [Deltaproteobacteria bacterium]
MIPSDTYISYLAAKKSVDDRALNRYVWQKLKAGLRPSTPREPLRVIEFGAGIGTMFERVVEWGLAPHMHYTLVEQNPDYLDGFRSRSVPEQFGRSHTPHERISDKAAAVETHGSPAVETLCADLYDVIAEPGQQGQWDLIIAHAVMDLVEAAEVLAGFARLVKPGGLLYLSLIYDGCTEFLPSEDPDFEQALLCRYHLSMDRRATRHGHTGTSRAARAMFSRLAALNLPILAAGGSDWLVYPRAGRYPADEAFFLDTIIDTIDRQLQQDPAVDPDRLAAWASRKHNRVKAGELIFMARNMDFLARGPALQQQAVTPHQPI